MTKISSINKQWLRNYPANISVDDIPTCSVYEYMYEANKKNTNDIALTNNFLKVNVTYEELFSKIDELAKILNRKGIQKGDVVALAMANIPESVYLIYALNKIGAISCMIDPRSNTYGIKRDLINSNAKMYIGINNSYKCAKNALKDIDMDMVMVSTFNSSSNSKLRMLCNVKDFIDKNYTLHKNKQWKHFLKDFNLDIQLPNIDLDKDQICTIVHTGGTTGVHKGVALTNFNVNSTVYSHKYIIENLNRGEVMLDILPQFIAYGFASLHLAVSLGLKTYLDPVPDPKTFIENVLKIKPSTAFGGPIHWERLIYSEDILKNKDLSFLKFPVSGGEKLSEVSEKAINRVFKEHNGPQLWNGYGASETNGVFSIKRGALDSLNTVGIPFAFNDLKILDINDGRELGLNQEGEVYITSPSLMKEYYNNPEETKKAIVVDKNGTRWFKTGDLGHLNDQGELTITGRIKRIFVCGMNKVYPPEMEELISLIPTVKKCVVVGVPDEQLRTVPKVHIVLKDNCLDKQKETIYLIEKLISEKIGNEVLPKYYAFDNELIYTPSGKIDFLNIEKKDIEEMKNTKKTLKR